MISIQGAPDQSIWRVSGNYPNGGTFTDCLATVLPGFTHGTDETLLQLLPPLHDLIAPENVTTAQLVIEDPWADLGHSVERVS